MDHIISETGYNKEMYADTGNRFLIGNGYLGVRGTYDEYEKDMLPAVNVAGLYDKAGDGWREPINAPNGLFACIRVDGKDFRIYEDEPLINEMKLDFKHAILTRSTTWETQRGHITFLSERFADAVNHHLIYVRYGIKADFHADVCVFFGTDTDIWELNGPHFDSIAFDEEERVFTLKTHEKGAFLYAGERLCVPFPCSMKSAREGAKYLTSCSFVTDIDKTYEVTKVYGVYEEEGDALRDVLAAFTEGSYEKAKAEHAAIWEKRMSDGGVLIDGDAEGKKAEKALNYALYHLNSIAPRHADAMSIPARGLSGQTYKGAIFWDTEMFMLDYFLLNEPAVARSLVMYRVKTLPGAIKKAKQYGHAGAFYAWESQEGGFDACSDYNVTDVFTGRPMRTYFRDKQIHISAAVVYGIMKYVDITGDFSVLTEGGEEVIKECARFYKSLLYKRYEGEEYELLDVIGPDEYHERVNNNAYTNRMVKYVFECATKVLSNDIRTYKEAEEYKMLAGKLKQQLPRENDLISQFDGYFEHKDLSIDEVRGQLLHEKEYWGGAYGVASETQVIKQADVVAMLELFPTDYSKKIMEANLDYYEKRTEHGSSLSASMHAGLFCRLGRPDDAWDFFMKSAAADINGGGKQWAGLVYIGGTHPAAEGGAYKNLIYGFAGVDFAGGVINITPKLPAHIDALSFGVTYKNKRYKIEITKENVHCHEI